MIDDCFVDYKKNIINNINNAIYVNGWNLRILSDKADIPYDSLKKVMNGKINNPSINSVIKLAGALNCSVDALLGVNIANTIQSNNDNNVENVLTEYSSANLPERAIQLIRELAEFETRLARENESKDVYYVPVINPTGLLNYGMIYDSMYMDKVNILEYPSDIVEEYVDISKYKEHLADNVLCGIRITGKFLSPVYLENDILLISRDRHPAYGETGVFVKNQKVYIRKYISGNPSVLMPVNGFGSPIMVENVKDWYSFGKVLTVIRKPS